MGGTYSKVKTVITGETITASDRNAEHDNHINNADPDGIGDASANTTEMQATADPYPGASPSLATDLRGEVQRLRYLIKQIIGEAQWYIDPDGSLQDIFTNAATLAGVKTLTDNPIITNAAPILKLHETGVTADNAKWWWVASSEIFRFRVYNDAEDTFSEIFTVSRTGTTADLLNILTTNLQHNNVKVPTISSTDTLTNKTLGSGLVMNGDAWPSFSVSLSGAQNDIASIDKIEFDTEVFDTNSDFDSATNFRFTPTVAGKYIMTVQLDWLNLTAGDTFHLYLYKNGAAVHRIKKDAAITSEHLSLTAIVDANGSSDYFEIFAQNEDRDTSDINAAITTFWMGSRIA
jgi:hypothetical protein